MEGGIWIKYHSRMATRQVPTLPGQHPSSVPRESEKDQGPWASVFGPLAGDRDCDGHQADREKASRGNHPAHDSRSAVLSRNALTAVTRRNGPQHGVYRALERDHARTTRQSDPQMSPCCPSVARTGNRHVSARLHLQFVFCASRIEFGQAFRVSLHACDGLRDHRSSLEHW